MPDYNKGDFTQQGIDGFVEGGLHLNGKRCLTAKISTDEETAGLDSVEINIHDHLNDLDYTITGENLVVGENTIGGGGGHLATVEFEENGTYSPSDYEAYGFGKVTVNVSGGGGFPTCEITLVPQAGGSSFDGYDASELPRNLCLDADGKLVPNIADYQTNLVVYGLYAVVGGATMIAYSNLNPYPSEADALASVTNKVNITVHTYENNGSYYVGIMPTNDTLPSSCTMEGNGK